MARRKVKKDTKVESEPVDSPTVAKQDAIANQIPTPAMVAPPVTTNVQKEEKRDALVATEIAKGVSEPTVDVPESRVVPLETTTIEKDKPKEIPVAVMKYVVPVPVFKDSFTSVLELEVSELKRFYRLVGKKEFHIKDFHSEREYYDSIFNWEMSMLKVYDVVIMDIPWVSSMIPGVRITKSGHEGFPIYAEYEKLSNDDRQQSTMAIFSVPHVDVDASRLADQVPVAGLKAELDIQVAISDLNFNFYMIEAIVMRDFLLNLNTQRMYLAEWPVSFKPHFEKVFHEPVTMNHYELMDQNLHYRPVVYAFVRNLVNTHMKLDSFAKNTLFKSLLRIVEARTGRFSDVNVLPATLLSKKAENVVLDWVTCVLLGRWYKINYQADLKTFDLCTLVDCILAKLLIKASVFTHDCLINIDNYIALWLIMKMRTFRTQSYRAEDVFTININHLSVLLGDDSYFTDTTAVSMMRAFLMTRPDGSGWAGGGQAPLHQYKVQGNQVRFHLAPFYHESQTGRPMDANENFVYQQLSNFDMFVKGLVEINQKWQVQKDRYQALVAVLTDLQGKMYLFQNFSFNMDVFTRVLALNCLTYEDTDNYTERQRKIINVSLNDYPDENENMRSNANTSKAINGQELYETAIKMDAGSFSSVAFGMDWKMLEGFPLDNEVVEDGFAWNNYLLDLVWNYALATLYMPKSLYSLKMRIEKAFSMTNNPLMPLVKEAFLGDAQSYVMPGHGLSNRLRKLKIMKGFLDMNHHLFGFSDNFYFMAPKDTANQGYKTAYQIHNIVAPRTDPDLIVNLSSFRKMKAESTLTETFDTIRDSGGIVKFEMPILIDLKEPVRSDFYQEIFVPDSMYIETKKLNIVTRWKDDFRLPSNNEFALLPPLLWGITQPPFILIDRNDFVNLLHPITVRKGYKVFNTFLRMARN